jgi:hypothetical protein
MNILQKKLLTWAENYMIKHYVVNELTPKMIPTAQIQPEMEKAIEREKVRVTAILDIDTQHKLETQAMGFFIIEARLKAENVNLRREISNFQQQKKDVSKLRNMWLERAEKIIQMASRMKNEGETLHSNTNSFIGAITSVYNEVKKDTETFDKNAKAEQKMLGQV